MNEIEFQNTGEGVDRAIALAEAALHVCDENGYLFAAIDVSSALDKLKAIKAEQEAK